MRLDSKENLGAMGRAPWGIPWGAAREERIVPARARGETPMTGDTDAAPLPRSRGRSVWRFLRDAAIGILLLACVPIALVSTTADNRGRGYESVRAKLLASDRLRSFIVTDASITPAQAGAALNALAGRGDVPGFRVRAAPAPMFPWRTLELTPPMFRSASTRAWNGPASSAIITATSTGFSAAELRFLAQVAEAPVWRDFDLVAHAPAVDMIGGGLVLPFQSDAFAPSMPMQNFAKIKELAYAGVSRAAYYLATGQPERAEAVLRGIVSFGYALGDNSTTAFGTLLGRIITDIGRDGLKQFYTVTGNVQGAQQAAFSGTTKTSNAGPREGESSTEWLVRLAGDPGEARAFRYESLRALSLQSCYSVRDLLFGPRTSVVDAFARAKRDLARYPSEQAFIDLLSQTVNRAPAGFANGNFANRFLAGASGIAGAALNNPRMPACTRLLIGPPVY